MKLERINTSFGLLKTILIETFRGKSLCRILMNYVLQEIELSGEILDLGAGSDEASYNRFLKRDELSVKITYTDFYKEDSNVLKLDLEKPFSIKDNQFDMIMCFNVLEHIYNYQNTVKESWRVLKPGGIFVGSTPFLINFHPDPNDYFRYTHQAIRRIFENNGFKNQQMIYLGFGPGSAALAQWILLFPRLIRPLFIFPVIVFDLLLNKLTKHYKMRHALGYVYVFKK